MQRLTAAVAESGHSSFLLQAIAEREGELAEVERLRAAAGDSVNQDQDELRRFALEQLSALPELLSADVGRARAELAQHVTQITMTPAQANGTQHYFCQGDWNLLGPTKAGDVRMVAGGGVSPIPTTPTCRISKFNVFMEPKEYSHPIKSLLTIRFQLKR